LSSNDAASLEHPRKPEGQASQVPSDLFWSVYEAHSQELLAFLIGVLRNVHDACEVSQIAFYRLLEAGRTINQETAKGWLFKVALHEALILKRKANRQDSNLKSYLQTHQVNMIVPSIDIVAMEQESIVRLKKLLGELPVEQQRVVKERIYEDKSFESIASELKIPLGTVLTRMRLALLRLRKWWEDD
jgi:RNA polymerase sigma-70 factor (ECF subfamily)